MVGGGKAADSRGEFFGSAAGIGDGASAWDVQPAPVRLAARCAKGGLAVSGGKGPGYFIGNVVVLRLGAVDRK